jgi:asparagine synthase (glutamine-hydrolysing)
MTSEQDLGNREELRHYLPLARFFWNEQMFGDPASRYYQLISRGAGGNEAGLPTVRDAFSLHTHLVDRMGRADIEISLPSLITMNDRAAAAWGLENRTPFLDLRKVARGLVPDSIIDRKDKKGLIVPIQPWLDKELRGWAGGLLTSLKKRSFYRKIPRHGISRGEFDRRLYSLLSLELWYRNVLSVPRAKRMEAGDRLRFRARAPERTAVAKGKSSRRRPLLAASPKA